MENETNTEALTCALCNEGTEAGPIVQHDGGQPVHLSHLPKLGQDRRARR